MTKEEDIRAIKELMPYMRIINQTIEDREPTKETSMPASREENIRTIKELIPYVRIINQAVEDREKRKRA
jgi:hypothetical protein